MAPVLELHGISKHFGPVEALNGADFLLEDGEIHALLGENGAGKSTLMSIAYGLLRPDAGEIRVRGIPHRFRDPTDARREGIGMVHQHFTSVPALTVAENIALGAGWSVIPRAMERKVTELAQRTGLPIDPRARVEGLPAGLKQRLEVLQALATDARILLLDEPSSVLSPIESDALLDRVREFRARGVSAVLITHKLDEAIRFADKVTVLRRGKVVHTGPASEQDATRLAELMIGDPAWRPPPVSTRRKRGEVRVRVQGLEVDGRRSTNAALRQASFTIRAGEIVGVAAVEGNGQRELLRAVAGLVPPTGGTLEVSDPVSFIPEDRTTESLIAEFSLVENLVLSQAADAPWRRGPWLNWRAAEQRTAELIEAFGIRAPSPRSSADALSGGNQQRLVVAAALERRPRVLVAENPTRGLDIKAAAEVHARLNSAASEGVAVLFHSSDLDEVLELAHRVLVVSAGNVVEVPPGLSRQELGTRMLVGPAAMGE